VEKKIMNIIYRLCEKETDGNLRDIRPKWYSKQKCLSSFLNSVVAAQSLINKVIFVHDGPGNILLEMIPEKYEIVKINNQDNFQSLIKTFDIADTLDDDIYFVEDDYLHLDDSVRKIALSVKRFGLVNGYDHLDRYTRTDDIDYPQKLVFDNLSNHHWRTAEATCCTYAVEGNLYKQISQIIRQYGLRDRDLFRYLWSQGIGLYTAVPGVTTQVDPYMSPGINWEKFNNDILF